MLRLFEITKNTYVPNCISTIQLFLRCASPKRLREGTVALLCVLFFIQQKKFHATTQRQTATTQRLPIRLCFLCVFA
jgi:hypothetical protein